MKKLSTLLLIFIGFNMNAKIEVLDRIAIIVDEGVVMESQINNAFKNVERNYVNQGIDMPPKELLLDQINEKLIIEELQLQLAERFGVKISDAELNISIERLAQNNQMNLEEFIVYLENNGESYSEVREDIRKEMKIQRVQRGKVDSNIDITEKEFLAFLETDESLVAFEPEILVRQILVKNKDQANKIISLINENSLFEDMAIKFSKSSNAASGGLMTWRKTSEMPELFENVLKNQPIGFISEPLESGSGYHILKLEDKRGDFVRFEDQWKTRHILMAPSAIRNSDETFNEISEVRDRIINGEDFSDLAKEFSEDPGSAKIGGELGWQGKGVFASEFEETMINSEIGNISSVFETQFGFHFLEVIETRNHEITQQVIENRAYQVLYSRKYDKELENTLRTMRAEAFVEFKDLD
tara:strand:+ start:6213 stop:7454 length:1242 start_codon:yes stop_codon:yes gene_type:complete